MKRLGSNEAAFRRLIETGITVGSVSETIYCVDESDIGDSLWSYLRGRGYDRCGVCQNDRIIGYVERPDVSSGGEKVLNMSVHQLIAETTPLWQAMARLAESRWLFVLTPEGPNGIVTVADLAKQPARLLMFGVISLLEMTMLALIRREYKDNSWEDYLKLSRVTKAQELLTQRRNKGQEIDLVDCLQWCDKATICASTKGVLECWNMGDTKECKQFLNQGQELRDLIAHAQHPAPDGEWSDVVQWLQKADLLIQISLPLIKDGAGEDVYGN